MCVVLIMPEFQDALRIRDELLSGGWVSPDTYANHFSPIILGPAVYLFLIYPDRIFDRALIGYVGMSKCLSQRLNGHEVYRKISDHGFWPCRWFMPTSAPDLRKVEADLIARFDPLYNTIGRPVGLDRMSHG